MSPSASSAASILLLHAFVVLTTTTLLLAAATASVPVADDDHRDDVNTPTMFTNGTVTSSTPSGSGSADDENWEMYDCFLCAERHVLLIHHCPIYWDECHLICWDWDANNAAIPGAPPAPARSSAVQQLQGQRHDEDCYVVKRYKSGRYVIVQDHIDCEYVGKWACFLSCGGGELAHHQRSVAATVTAAIQGSFVPLPSSSSSGQVCNTQAVNALRAPPSAAGVVVPAGGGGAH